MSSLAVSAKYKLVLFVIMMPIAVLFNQFISEKNDVIQSLQNQSIQLKSLRSEALMIQQQIGLSSGAKRLSDFDFRKKLDHFEYLSTNSHLLFESNIYTYYLVKISLNELPLLYKKLYALDSLLKQAALINSNKRDQLLNEIKNSLDIISETVAKATSLKAGHGATVKLSSGLLLMQTTQNLESITKFQAHSKRLEPIYEMEKGEVNKLWNNAFDALEESLTLTSKQLQSARNRYLVLFALLILFTMVVTVKIFSDLSRRIQKLTQMTLHTDPEQLSIQSDDFGYDEIGQLAQSFHTMSLIIKDNYKKIVQTNLQLAEANEKAEAATVAKSLFIANVSHELRTPISGIIGMSKILSQTELTLDQKKYLSILQKSSDMLLILINDILDLSKIENNKMQLENIDFNPRDVLQDTFECLAHLGQQKNLEMQITVPFVISTVYGDKYKIKQILYNLMSNAIKFTEKGRVEIFLEPLEDNESSLKLKLGVRDQGIGISKENLALLFQDFVQADSSMTRKYGGTGLGLSLAKKIVQLMDGDIFASSEIGQGSCFWFEITLMKAQHIPLTVKNKNEASSSVLTHWNANRKVLVAEDNPVNMLIIEKFLQSIGFDCLKACDGLQVIDMLEKNNDIEIILMDCQMPVLDGYQATQMIRQHPDLKIRNLPVIALTANTMNADKKKCEQAGMTDFMTKPLDFEKLKAILQLHSGVNKAA